RTGLMLCTSGAPGWSVDRGDRPHVHCSTRTYVCTVKRTLILICRQDDLLAKDPTIFEQRLGLRDAFEGVGSVDDGLQLPVADQAQDGLQLGAGPTVAPDDLELLGEEIPEVQLPLHAARRPAGDQTTIPSERGDALLPRGGADVLDD